MSAHPMPEQPVGEHPILAARDVAVTFRRGRDVVRAVDGLDLEVARGEILALVGESGCGKSTLARSLLGLVAPGTGTISHDGRRLPTRGKELTSYRRRVQLRPAGPVRCAQPAPQRLRGRRRGAAHPQGARRRDRARGRGPVEGRPAATGAVLPALSTRAVRGPAPALVIAGALVLEPDVIVADEPVSALDASVRGEILALRAHLAGGAGTDRRRRHARPRAGLEHRRPDRRHVPGTDRRGGHGRRGARRPSSSLHPGTPLRRPRDPRGGAGGSRRGAPGRDGDPLRMPVPAALLGLRGLGGRGAPDAVPGGVRRSFAVLVTSGRSLNCWWTTPSWRVSPSPARTGAPARRSASRACSRVSRARCVPLAP